MRRPVVASDDQTATMAKLDDDKLLDCAARFARYEEGGRKGGLKPVRWRLNSSHRMFR